MMSNLNQSFEFLKKQKTNFGPEAATGKLKALQNFKTFDNIRAGEIPEVHELLLFIRTYPDSPDVLKAVGICLDNLKKLLHQKRRSAPEAFRKRYADTGIAFSTVRHAPSPDIAEWLCRNFENNLTDVSDPDAVERIGPVISLLVSGAEQNGLEHESFDAHDWLKMAKGKRKTFLSWLAQRAKCMIEEEFVRDHIFETAQPEVEWNLDNVNASRTGNIIESSNIYFQQRGFIKSDLHSLIQEQMPPARLLKGKEVKNMYDSMCAVLAVRSRETDPVTYAEKIYEAIPYPGLSVFLTEMRPTRKLPMENYTGYVAYRNGVPVAYGGGWMFGNRCEFGINIFETFRGGENARLFAGLLKVYRNLCNARKFTVQPYQFGADNDEGLKSGAFWFYYRMGFRPGPSNIKKLAAAEFKRLLSGKGGKTPLSLLRKFAGHPVELVLEPDPKHTEPKEISIAVTRQIAARFNGNTEAALHHFYETTGKILNIGNKKAFKGIQATGLRTWAPVIALLPGTASWTASQRSIVRNMLKCKSSDEMSFSKMFAENGFFKEALYDLHKGKVNKG